MLARGMNVACTNCGKALALPAGSAVAGVKLRVKCKSCQTIFEVTEQLLAAAAAEEQKQQAAALEAVPDAPQAESPKPSDPNAIGEVTRHFINQSGANRRNPPWKIALFIVGGVGLPVGVLFLLSTFKVVSVTVTNAKGEQVQEPFFSAEGMSGIGDLLSGKAAERKAAAEKAKAEAEAKRRAELGARSALDGAKGSSGAGLDPGERRGGSAGEVATADPRPVGSLGAFYADTEKKDRGPHIRAGEEGAAKEHAGGLDETEAAKVVAHSQMAFQDCIESALRRNPSLKVGKVSMAVAVAPSGVVKGATIAPKGHETSDWGACLITRARRMVFPPFDGDEEAEIQVPLVVGVAL
jgi:phage FluMu protein Com